MHLTALPRPHVGAPGSAKPPAVGMGSGHRLRRVWSHTTSNRTPGDARPLAPERTTTQNHTAGSAAVFSRRVSTGKKDGRFSSWTMHKTDEAIQRRAGSKGHRGPGQLSHFAAEDTEARRACHRSPSTGGPLLFSFLPLSLCISATRIHSPRRSGGLSVLFAVVSTALTTSLAHSRHPVKTGLVQVTTHHHEQCAARTSDRF